MAALRPFLLSGLFLLWGCAASRPPAEAPLRPLVRADSIMASAVVETKKGLVNLRGQAFVAARTPGSFRIEVTGPFGTPVALLVSDGTSFQAVSDGTVESRRWDDPELSERPGPDEVVALLLGRDPSVDHVDAVAKRDERGRLTKYSRTKDGAGLFTATLSGYREVGGSHIPFNITITDRSGTIRIRYDTIEVNPLIDDEIFAFEDWGAPQSK